MSAIGPLSNVADAQLVATTKDWNLTDFDRLAKNPARVKQVYDISAIGGGKFLNNIKNSLNGLHFGFGIPDGQIKVVAALHGPANMLNFDDTIWDKYKIGAWLNVEDPATGMPATRNPFYPSKGGTAMHYPSQNPDSDHSIYQDTSIAALRHRGVQFLSCHTAIEEQVRKLIPHNHLSVQPEEVVKDMLAHALPGVLVVAAMVAAIALLQTDGHYTYITV